MTWSLLCFLQSQYTHIIITLVQSTYLHREPKPFLFRNSSTKISLQHMQVAKQQANVTTFDALANARLSISDWLKNRKLAGFFLECPTKSQIRKLVSAILNSIYLFKPTIFLRVFYTLTTDCFRSTWKYLHTSPSYFFSSSLTNSG